VSPHITRPISNIEQDPYGSRYIDPDSDWYCPIDSHDDNLYEYCENLDVKVEMLLSKVKQLVEVVNILNEIKK